MACSIALAYYTSRNKYDIIRELPAGKGFADLAFIPRHGVDTPAMIVELKYDESADSAIWQINEKRYHGALAGLSKDVLLVGISYNKKSKKHECIITSL